MLEHAGAIRGEWIDLSKGEEVKQNGGENLPPKMFVKIRAFAVGSYLNVSGGRNPFSRLRGFPEHVSLKLITVALSALLPSLPCKVVVMPFILHRACC